jgi:hypothetical protein
MLLLYFVQHFQSVPFSLFKAISSVSMSPSASHESGHFYFAQTGHSHFAATFFVGFVSVLLTRCLI